MLNKKQQDYGITPPISKEPPNKRDLELTQALIKSLDDLGQFETPEESAKREEVLGELASIFKAFVRQVSINKSMPESMANDVGGKIFTFGSYRLGVHKSGTDIDTLCVAPKHVSREDFFTTMYDMLRTRPEVTELTPVHDAFVPVMNFVFSGIHIDLLFAPLGLPQIKDDLDLSNNDLLKGLDEPGIRSLNGSRVTDEILRLVPDVNTFRMALRAIKLWAKARAVYSNKLGFLGGVAWAMLVARVCQLYQNASAGKILTSFFRIMQKWPWPRPIMLKHIEDGPLQVRVWNPRVYPSDRAHKMPIITPAYPSMCATHNVTDSTLKIMTKEFERAADMMDQLVINKAEWKDLFDPTDFFNEYKYYIQVVAGATSEDKYLLWVGLVESRLRQLLMKLELVENVELVHPWVDRLESVNIFNTLQEASDGGYYKVITDEKPKNDAAFVPKKLLKATFYIGFQVAQKSGKLDLQYPIRVFKDMTISWEKFNPSSMGVTVEPIKSSALPNELFKGFRKRKRKGDQESMEKKATLPTNEHTESPREGSIENESRVKRRKVADESSVTTSKPKLESPTLSQVKVPCIEESESPLQAYEEAGNEGLMDNGTKKRISRNNEIIMPTTTPIMESPPKKAKYESMEPQKSPTITSASSQSMSADSVTASAHGNNSLERLASSSVSSDPTNIAPATLRVITTDNLDTSNRMSNLSPVIIPSSVSPAMSAYPSPVMYPRPYSSLQFDGVAATLASIPPTVAVPQRVSHHPQYSSMAPSNVPKGLTYSIVPPFANAAAVPGLNRSAGLSQPHDMHQASVSFPLVNANVSSMLVGHSKNTRLYESTTPPPAGEANLFFPRTLKQSTPPPAGRLGARALRTPPPAAQNFSFPVVDVKVPTSDNRMIGQRVRMEYYPRPQQQSYHHQTKQAYPASHQYFNGYASGDPYYSGVSNYRARG